MLIILNINSVTLSYPLSIPVGYTSIVYVIITLPPNISPLSISFALFRGIIVIEYYYVVDIIAYSYALHHISFLVDYYWLEVIESSNILVLSSQYLCNLL